MARSAVKGRRLAGMHPWKRNPFVMAGTLPGGDGKRVGDVADGLDRALVVEDDRNDVEAAGDLPEPLELEIAVRPPAEPVLLAGVHGDPRGVALGRPGPLDPREDRGLARL